MALIRVCVCVGWSESLLVAHTTLLEISFCRSIMFLGICYFNQFKLLFWVPIRTTSLRQFILVPTIIVLVEKDYLITHSYHDDMYLLVAEVGLRSMIVAVPGHIRLFYAY